MDLSSEWSLENVLAGKCDTAQSKAVGGEIFADMAPGEDLNLLDETEENTPNDETVVIISFS